MRLTHLCRIVFCWLVIARFTLPLTAQVGASLTGLVTDASQSPVPGTKVTVRDSNTSLERTAETDSAGYYFFAALPVGTYLLTVEHAGFQTAKQTVRLETAQKARADFDLNVSQVETAITVDAVAPQLSSQDASVSSVVDNTYVSQFPLLLRSWDDLLNVAAGVQLSRYTEQGGATSAGRTGGFNVHGVRSLQNNFILDGADNNSISENVQELTTQVVRPSVDTIQEFKILTNPYTAEYGRSPGAAVVVTTKGGTNEYHGVAYEYLRNHVLDANDFFSNRSGLPKPENVQNQFGGNLGGPIVKNHLFAFFDYEGTRVRRGASRIATVPLANERIGDFSPGSAPGVTYPAIYDFTTGAPFTNNRIPASRLDPVMQKLMALFPNPTQGGQQNNFVRNATISDDTDRYSARGDWTATDKDNLFVRWTYSTRARHIPGNFGGIADGTASSSGGLQNLNAFGVSLGYNHVFTPRIVNEFRAGVGRDNSFAQQDPFGLNKTSDYIPGVPLNPAIDGGVSRTTFTGFNTFIGSPDFLPKFQKTLQYQFSDAVSIASGKHSIKTGVDLRAPLRNIFMDVPSTRGTLSFDRIFTCQRNSSNQCVSNTGLSYADGLLGYVQQGQLTNVYFVDQRLFMLSGFVQDDFKVTRRLTINLGLRYDFSAPAVEGQNHLSNFGPGGAGALLTAKDGSLADRSLTNPNYHNFAPRAGFAYQIDDKTVLRAGYGIFYQLFERYGSEDQLSLNPPFLINNVPAVASNATAPVFFLRNGFPLDFLDPAKLDLRRVRVRAVNPDSPNPSVQQWSFGIQRSLPAHLFLQADYVGTKTTHLTALSDFNQPINGIKPYANFGYIEYRNPTGNGHYHGLDLTLERRFQSDLTFRLAYTLSKSIDNVAEPLNTNSGNAQNGRDYTSWRALSDFDIPQRLVGSFVYDLPFGKGKKMASSGVLMWLIGGFRTSGSYTYAAGRPFTVTAGGSLGSALDPFGAATALPNLLGPVATPHDVDCWFYNSRQSACRSLAPGTTDSLQLQQPGQTGSAGRNILRGPNTRVFDFSLQRSFPIKERMGLEFRWEIFNLFNTTQFSLPNRDFSSSAAGTITTLAGDPRVMQFALRFMF
jgi:hypothetical protein